MTAVIELRVMGSEGDVKVVWDADDKKEVESARTMFNDLLAKGYSAFRVKHGEKAEKVTAFDPKAGSYIMVPRIVGG